MLNARIVMPARRFSATAPSVSPSGRWPPLHLPFDDISYLPCHQGETYTKQEEPAAHHVRRHRPPRREPSPLAMIPSIWPAGESTVRTPGENTSLIGVLGPAERMGISFDGSS